MFSKLKNGGAKWGSFFYSELNNRQDNFISLFILWCKWKGRISQTATEIRNTKDANDTHGWHFFLGRPAKKVRCFSLFSSIFHTWILPEIPPFTLQQRSLGVSRWETHKDSTENLRKWEETLDQTVKPKDCLHNAKKYDLLGTTMSTFPAFRPASGHKFNSSFSHQTPVHPRKNSTFFSNGRTWWVQQVRHYAVSVLAQWRHLFGRASHSHVILSSSRDQEEIFSIRLAHRQRPNFLFIAFLFDEFFLPQRSRETECVQQEACSQSEIISASFSKVTAAPEKTTTRKQWQVKNQFCIWGWSRAAARWLLVMIIIIMTSFLLFFHFFLSFSGRRASSEYH